MRIRRLKNLVKFISKDESRPVLHNICVFVRNDEVHYVATDGKRMAHIVDRKIDIPEWQWQNKWGCGTQYSLLCQQKIKAYKEGDIATLLSEETLPFPSVFQVIPKQLENFTLFEMILSVKTEGLDALEYCAKIATPKKNGVKCIQYKNGTAQFIKSMPFDNNFYYSTKQEKDEVVKEVILEPKYLLDATDIASCLWVKDAHSPVIVCDSHPQDELMNRDFALIMPMREC